MLSLKRKAWKSIASRLGLQWTLSSGYTVKICSFADWCTYNDVFVDGEYCMAVDSLLTEQDPTLRVLDLGSNVGFFAIYLFHQSLLRNRVNDLHVHLVEGSPYVFLELQRRILILPSQQIDRCENGLIGSRHGIGSLNNGIEDIGNYVGPRHVSNLWSAKRGSTSVPYLDISQSWSGEVIHLVKCDIEGSEFSFIDNYPSLLRRTKRLAIEFHHDFGDHNSALLRLKQLGFDQAHCTSRKDNTSTWCLINSSLLQSAL